MYDQAFYDAAAARIADEVFYELAEDGLVITLGDSRSVCDIAAVVPTVMVAFAPGDATLYKVTIAKMPVHEAVVAVGNMGLCFAVPFGAGAYVHPSYLASRVRGHELNPATAMAVAAVVNRAIRSVFSGAAV